MTIFINMEMIKLKTLLAEQITDPSKRDAKLFATKSFNQYSLDAYKEKYPSEYKIAKTIYNAKGWLWDDEVKVIKALRSIKTKKQFDIIQKIFNKISGKNIIQYIASYIEVGTNLKYGPISLKYIKTVITHLNNIGVSNTSLKPLFDKLIWVDKWYKRDVDQAQQPTPGGELAWDTWMKRSLMDPEFKHQYFLTLSILTSFIPGAGLLISSGIMLADAAAYWNEGNRLNAGYSTIFALLPAALKGITKIPFIKRLGAEGMAILAEKLATSKYNLLTKIEVYAVQELVENNNLIKRNLDAYFKARAKNELAMATARASSKGIKGILKKIGNGTLKMSVLGTKTAAHLGTFFTAQDVSNKVWDKIYVDLGMDIEDYVDSKLNRMSSDSGYQKAKEKLSYGK